MSARPGCSSWAHGRGAGDDTGGPEWRGTIDASWDELVELLRDELRRAIGDRIGGDERAGAILSGGVDSSVVLATAAGLDPRPELRAYSTVFPDWPAADESDRIVVDYYRARACRALGSRFALRVRCASRSSSYATSAPSRGAPGGSSSARA